MEHLVRLGEIRIVEYRKDTKRAQALRQLHIGTYHFVFIPVLEEKMKVYEYNRQRYPAFKDFLPELLEVFKTATPAQVDAWLKTGYQQ